MASLARTVLQSLLFAIPLLLPSCGLLGLIVPGPILSAIDPPDPLPTIPGPEDEHLLDDVHGTLLWFDQGSWLSDKAKIEIVSLPDLTRQTLLLDGPSRSFSGPDDRGRFVYFTFTGVHLHDPSKKQDTTFVEWEEGEGTVSEAALAHRDGRMLIAFSRDFRQGETRTTVNDLQLWNLDSGERRALGPLAIDHAHWFPDGRHVAVEIEEMTPASERRPSIQVLDVDTGRLRWIAWGRQPHVNPNGRSLLYRCDHASSIHWHDLETRTERIVTLPGILTDDPDRDGVAWIRGRCFGWLSETVVLYEALATEGDDPGYVPAQKLMMGYYPKWTVKAADVETGAFMTVMPSVNDPFGSFGVWTPSK